MSWLGLDFLVTRILFHLLGLRFRSLDLGLLEFREVVVEFLPSRVGRGVLGAKRFVFAEQSQKRSEHVLACGQTREGFLYSGIVRIRMCEHIKKRGIAEFLEKTLEPTQIVFARFLIRIRRLQNLDEALVHLF